MRLLAMGHPCCRPLLHLCASVPVLIRAAVGHPIRLPVFDIALDDRLLLSLSALILMSALFEVVSRFIPGLVRTRRRVLAHLPDNVCYYCVQQPAASKCGGCHLVFYCGRVCQMAAWRKHRHACGAAVAAAARVDRHAGGGVRVSLTPTAWRALQRYLEHVRSLFPTPKKCMTPVAQSLAQKPQRATVALREMGRYVTANPEVVTQEMADAVWAAGVSMRTNGDPDRFHVAWAWTFLEASVEGGSARAFLGALGVGDEGVLPRDFPRVTRWLRRGVWQALLMLNNRNEIGRFLMTSPEIG